MSLVHDLDGPDARPPTLSLDDRQLLVELQSLGVRMPESDDAGGRDSGSRRGGAGPSDALFLWVRSLPLTVPRHASFVSDSPYEIRHEDSGSQLYRHGSLVGPVRLPRRPRIYDMETADGIPYWKIALLHLDSHRVARWCRRASTGTRSDQCRFCGIGLTRGPSRRSPVKTPEQLAEVRASPPRSSTARSTRR